MVYEAVMQGRVTTHFFLSVLKCYIQAFFMIKNKKTIPILIIIITIGIIFLFWFSIKPSNSRDWAEDQEVLAYAEIYENEINIFNIRNFEYTSTTEYRKNYYDKTFNLDEIKSVDYIVEPFSEWEGSAHTFLSFGFENNEYVSISVEIRKEKGESFSAVKGLFKQYEIMYVIADERDVIKLRSNFRKDKVFVYPIKSSKENIQSLFLGMIEKANELKEHPEFYNTLTNTCTTKIAHHVNDISPKRIPLSYKVLFPGYSDQLVYDLGLIDTDLPLEEIREIYLINEKALEYAGSEDFSLKIRE